MIKKIIDRFSKEVNIDELEEYQKKIFKHRRKRIRRAGIIVAAVIIVLAFWTIFQYTRIYQDYIVLSSQERSDVQSAQFKEFNGNILKYSQDGIACLDVDNNVIWNHTFSIQEPIVSIREDYVAVADQKGSKIYVLNKQGLQGEIKTLRPILQIKVANQGMVAVVTEGEDGNNIYCYDKSGKLLVDSEAHMENSGYPMSIALSNDGKKLGVSYLHVSDGVVKTNIAFYNFGPVGQEEEDRLVCSYTYKNTVVPGIEFLDNDTAVAFGDNKIIVFEGSQKPKVTSEISIEEEIKSVFYNDKNFGLVFKNEDSESKYRMNIYNKKGKQKLSTKFNTEFTNIELHNKIILIYGESECSILSYQGVERFYYKFPEELLAVIPTSFNRQFILITSKDTQRIQIK